MSWRGYCCEEVTKRHLSCFCFVFVELCVVPLVRVTLRFRKWELAATVGSKEKMTNKKTNDKVVVLLLLVIGVLLLLF